ncbi:MAG: hypothetical protein KF831_17355 [Acidobacteria bacterium]|nr:hypothetical protein [Acidobacteriota bacterium]
MAEKENTEVPRPEEMPDEWWYKVYVAVMVTTVAVIFLLWLFSRYFAA